jgi:hypothetical protein
MKVNVMTTSGRKPLFTLFVDRFTSQWVVRDAEGRFWMVPSEDSACAAQPERFFPTEDTEPEPVPGHYKHMLGITN